MKLVSSLSTVARLASVAPAAGSAAPLAGATWFQTMSVGASLVPLTVMPPCPAALENAVAPPLTVVSAKPPWVPLLWSQARKVIALVSVPLKSAFGRK